MKPPVALSRPRWIWLAEDTGPNVWVAFRKSFDLAGGQVTPGKFRIACADKYWLWINGKPVVREGGLKSGPTRTDWYVDEVDAGPFLKTGRNQIAVLAWHFGRDGASHRNSGRGGLWVDGSVGTDRTWKVRRHPAFGQRGGGTSVTLAEQAVDFDAGADMSGWIEAGFGDAQWEDAEDLGAPPMAPWGALVPRPLPLWRDSEPTDYVNQSENGLPIAGPAVVVGRLPENLQVYPRFRLRARAGLEIGVQAERDKKKTLYRTRGGEQGFEVPTWGNGHAVTYTIPAGVELLEISYRETGYDCGKAGRFSSSDEALNRLWGKAAHTARLCMRDTFMDCPDRERSPWIGDAANILEVTLRSLDRRSDALIVKTADELAGWATPEGNLWSAVPTSRFAGTFREFPAQALLFLGFGLPAYWTHTDDRALLERFYPAMRRYLLELYHVRAGIVAHRGPWSIGWGAGVQCWYDWEDNIDGELLDQLLYFAALGGLDKAASLLGRREDQARCGQVRREMRTAFDGAYWADDIGGYRSARHDGPPDERAQALAIVTGMAPVERHARLAERIEETERCSIYLERFPLEALTMAGRPQSALRRLKRRFSAEIASEYSTLPERFGEESNHAWGGAAIVLLAEKLMGVAIVESGCRRVRFAPPAGLESAEYVLPTIHGELHLGFRRAEGAIDYKITVPAGIVVWLGNSGDVRLAAGTWQRRIAE